MNGYIGLGSKPLKICSAVPKPKDGQQHQAPSATAIVQQAYEYSQYYYDQYSNYYQQGYNNYDSSSTSQTAAPIDPTTYYSQQAAAYAASSSASAMANYSTSHASYSAPKYDQDDDYALVDYKTPVDVEKLNREKVDMERNLYDALESSKWQPLELLETFWND